MSQEKFSEQTQPGQTGLSPGQQHVAVYLRLNAYDKWADLQDVERDQRDLTRYRATRGVGNPDNLGVIEGVRHAVAQHKANQAERFARRHYVENAGAYQEQALIQATEAGKQIDGWTHPEK